MGVHISFVRSLKMDRWKAHELKQMELGGNKLAKAFYEKNGMLPQGGTPDHKNPALARYKNDLKIRAAKAIGAEPAAPQPVPQQMPKDVNNLFGADNIVLKIDQKKENQHENKLEEQKTDDI